MPGSTRSFEMAKRLVERGHTVNLISTKRTENNSNKVEISEEAGIKIHWIPVTYSNHMNENQKIAAFLKFILPAAKRAYMAEADVVLATSTPLTVFIPGFYAAYRKGVPLVFEVRDLWPSIPIALGSLKNPFLRLMALYLEKIAYKKSEAIVALSSGIKNEIAKNGININKITEIPNGCDLEHFKNNPTKRIQIRSQLKISPRTVLVLYAGTFGIVNDTSYLIKIAERLKGDSRVHFLMIGDGIEFKKVQTLARKNGILDINTTILPSATKNEISNYFSAADIAVSLFSPIKEMQTNSANKFFDGLASGCCIAINYGGWQEELLNKSGAGIKLSQNIDYASEQLKALISNQNALLAAKKAARNLAEKQFSRDFLAVKLESVLLEAIKSYRESKKRDLNL